MRSTLRSTFSRQGRLPAIALLAMLAVVPAHAQRHSLGSAPPTAPLAKPATSVPPATSLTKPGAPASPSTTAPAPIAPVSAGLGAIQFLPSSLLVPAPQALTRQLSSDDERTRSGALSSLGAPGQYLARGHVPYPHSVQLDLVQLGESDQIDALLTVELDQHIVTAVMVPQGDSWRRIATVSFANTFSNGTTTPATFVRPLRSWLQPDRYRAVFHASVSTPAGDFTENEADLNVVNDRPVIVLDFVSGARQCDTTGQLRPPRQTCELIQRWLEPDPADPTRHFALITAMGHFSAHEANDPLSRSRNYRLTHLHTFTCQPFIFSEQAMHFVPTANAIPCGVHEPRTEHPELAHPDAAHPEAGHAELSHGETTKPEHSDASRPEHPDSPQHP